MAKKSKKVTRSVMPLMNLLCGMDIVTSYDTETAQFVSVNNKNVDVFAKKHNEVMKSFASKLTRKEADIYEDLCREHCRKLIDDGYGMRRSAFKKLDAIDLRALPAKPGENVLTMPSFCLLDNTEYREYVIGVMDRQISESAVLDNLLCLIVPPFTEFGIYVTKHRYTYVKVMEIDMIGHSITAVVQDYTVRPEQINWVAGAKCTARISLERVHPGSRYDVASYAVEIELQTSCDPHDINVMVPYEELGWNKDQIRIWETMDKHYTEPVMANLASIGRSSCIELVKYAVLCCAVSNYMLYGNRPVIQKEPKEEREKRPKPVKGEAATEEGPAPKRRVRTVGLVTMKSAAVPKRATPDTVRKWKVPSWKARGGVRRMRDGRLIPFKESIRHRKALMDKDNSVLPVTLKMKDNRPE